MISATEGLALAIMVGIAVGAILYFFGKAYFWHLGFGYGRANVEAVCLGIVGFFRGLFLVWELFLGVAILRECPLQTLNRRTLIGVWLVTLIFWISPLSSAMGSIWILGSSRKLGWKKSLLIPGTILLFLACVASVLEIQNTWEMMHDRETYPTMVYYFGTGSEGRLWNGINAKNLQEFKEFVELDPNVVQPDLQKTIEPGHP